MQSRLGVDIGVIEEGVTSFVKDDSTKFCCPLTFGPAGRRALFDLVSIETV